MRAAAAVKLSVDLRRALAPLRLLADGPDLCGQVGVGALARARLPGQMLVKGGTGDLQMLAGCASKCRGTGFCLAERLRWLRTAQPDGKIAVRHGHHHGLMPGMPK
jgi:hypothetical protein